MFGHIPPPNMGETKPSESTEWMQSVSLATLLWLCQDITLLLRSASERIGNNFNGFRDFYLRVKAHIPALTVVYVPSSFNSEKPMSKINICRNPEYLHQEFSIISIFLLHALHQIPQP